MTLFMYFNKHLSILGNMNMPLGEAIVLVINMHLLVCLMENSCYNVPNYS